MLRWVRSPKELGHSPISCGQDQKRQQASRKKKEREEEERTNEQTNGPRVEVHTEIDEPACVPPRVIQVSYQLV
jgi:hypothetical protein